MRGRVWILLATALAFTACSKSASTSTPATAPVVTSALAATPSSELTSSAPSSPSPPPETTAPAGVISGTWKGTYESKFGVSGPFTATFQQAGAAFTGTITVKGSGCVAQGTLAGSVTGTAIEFGAVQAAHTVTFKGKISGDTMSGTYDAPTCGPDSGTWSAHRS